MNKQTEYEALANVIAMMEADLYLLPSTRVMRQAKMQGIRDMRIRLMCLPQYAEEQEENQLNPQQL